jgi:hypothetical protein
VTALKLFEEQVAGSSAQTYGDVSADASERGTAADKKAVEQHAVGLVAAIANRRAAAVVESIWETAKGFSDLGDFNYWGAAQHFLSAAEYGVLAGTGSGHHAAIAGGSVGTRESASGERRGSSGSRILEPQTLAPGAAGAGGRFGNLHVIVVGEAQAGQWLANTLNNAVNRGVTLMATSSQRGSPVGH